MSLRPILFAVMAVGLCGFGIFGWRAAHQPPPQRQALAATAPAPVMLGLLVAAHDLAPGSFLRPDDLSAVSVARDAASPEARRDTPAARAEVIGALVRRPILHGSALQPADLLLAGTHGFLAALLTPGMRAFTISHEQLVSDAGLIWPGDRLDLILTQQMPNVLPGRQMSAETVLINLRVLAIDRQLVPVQAPDPRAAPGAAGMPGAAVTVEVSPDDAVRLALALRLGKVAFAIRSATPGDADRVAAGPPAAPGATIWAGNVMHSLDDARPPPPAASIHVFEGDGDREYKF